MSQHLAKTGKNVSSLLTAYLSIHLQTFREIAQPQVRPEGRRATHASDPPTGDGQFPIVFGSVSYQIRINTYPIVS